MKFWFFLFHSWIFRERSQALATTNGDKGRILLWGRHELAGLCLPYLIGCNPWCHFNFGYLDSPIFRPVANPRPVGPLMASLLSRVPILSCALGNILKLKPQNPEFTVYRSESILSKEKMSPF